MWRCRCSSRPPGKVSLGLLLMWETPEWRKAAEQGWLLCLCWCHTEVVDQGRGGEELWEGNLVIGYRHDLGQLN